MDARGRTGLTPDQMEAAIDADYLRRMLAYVPAFVVRLDHQLRIRYINRLQPGHTLTQTLGRSSVDFIDPAHVQLHLETIERARRTGKPDSYVVKGSGPGGRDAYYETRVVPTPEADGRIGVTLVATDVTQHMERAQALRASEEKLRVAVEATGIGLWTWHLPSGRVEWDQGMRRIVGTPHVESLADYVDRCVHPEDRACVKEGGEKLRAGGRVEPRPHRILRSDGNIRWVMPSGVPITDDAGRVTHVMGGLLDVTEQQRIEEKLRQAQKLETVGNFTAGVAHNFNNLLAVIMPALELARADVASTRAAVVDEAIVAARRAAELVNGLMAVAGQQRGGEPRLVGVGAAVRSAVGTYDRAFRGQHTIDVSPIPGSLFVECHEGAMEQILVNLLTNAHDAVVAAGREEPRIALKVERRSAEPDTATMSGAPMVRITVSDNGAGMSEELAARVFEPFFTTKEPGQGTGLGLATAYAIARHHGGKLGCRSCVGAGSAFFVDLPLSDAGAGTTADAEDAPAPRTGVPEVLIIDDEEAIRTVIAHFLEEDGFRVAQAGNVDAALSRLDEGARPRVVLLDRSMPGGSGMGAIPEIRRRAPDAAILYFTGQDVSPQERSAVDGVVAKPIPASELLSVIRRHAR